jgi:hypothetical protein
MEYPFRTFVDQHGREIEVDESLSLRDAILGYGRARKALWDHRWNDMPEGMSYEDHQKKERLLSNATKIAMENYDAAFYRTTGYWPGIINSIDWNAGNFKD